MSLKPKTKVEELLERLTSFSKGKVLSEFELTRYLGQAKSLVDIDPAESWHIRGLIYFYANQVDNMHHAFKTALKLKGDGILLNNAIACYMNQGGLHSAFRLFEENFEYFLHIKDYDLILKLHRLALNLYELKTIDRLKEILIPYNSISEIATILEVVEHEVANLNDQHLRRVGVEWGDANKIASQVIEVLKECKLRPSSLVEIDFLDGEVINSFYIFSDVSSILKANDLLFEKVYTQDLLQIWNKLMFMFVCTAEDDSVRNVA